MMRRRTAFAQCIMMEEIPNSNNALKKKNTIKQYQERKTDKFMEIRKKCRRKDI